MAVFYSDTASFGDLEVSGSGQNILTVSGSTGALLSVSDPDGSGNLLVVRSGSLDILKINNSSVVISGSLLVSGSISGDDMMVAAGGVTNTLSQLVFSNANGVSFGLNGSTITATVAGGGGGGTTFNYYNPKDGYLQVATQLGQNTLFMQPSQLPNVAFDRIMMPVNYTNASNSSNSFTVSMNFAFYTKSDLTLSLVSSFSTSYNITNSGTVGSYTRYGGSAVRNLSLAIGSTLTFNEGQYYVGMFSRTTTGGGAGMTMSNMVASQIASAYSGFFGEASNSTQQYTRGLGVYSATTNAFPSSIGFSQLVGAGNSSYLRQPVYYLVNGTV